ncbi:hypothetical protein [Isoptericola aurantiacus]|uniref:hypothetical protein n=1 Tax=Isoptericola aurantiacus TaxID=3377839 RepID=UPI00383A72B8
MAPEHRSDDADHQCHASTRDRAVYGWSVALLGCVAGAVVALVAGQGDAGLSGIGIPIAAVLVAVSWWRELGIRATPRHARRTDLIGSLLSCVLWVVIWAQFAFFDATALSPVLSAALGALVAAPAATAGWLIRRTQPPTAPHSSAADRPRSAPEDADQVRDRIITALTTVDEAEREVVHSAVPVGTAMFDDQVAVLVSSGDVRVRQWWIRAHPRTWLRLTARGRAKAEPAVTVG